MGTNCAILLDGPGNKYSYAGLTLSSSWELPELPRAVQYSWCAPDISIYRLAAPPRTPDEGGWVHDWRSPHDSDKPFLSLFKIDEQFLLRFPGLADFLISIGDKRVGAWTAPKTSAETLRHLLLNQVLPRVLSQQGKLVLHAGAIEVGGQCVAFLGQTGSGKSTLTASFQAQNYPLLSDDTIVVTQGRLSTIAQPTYRSLRLWPEAVAGLYAKTPAPAPVSQYTSKTRVILADAAATAIAPLHLGALYVLAEDESAVASISLARLSKREGCIAIISNAMPLDVTDNILAAKMLETASKIAERVPLFLLTFPRLYGRLPDVHKAVLQQRSQWAPLTKSNPDYK